MNDFYVEQLSLTDDLAKLGAQVEVQSTKNQTAVVAIENNNSTLATQTVTLKKGKNTYVVIKNFDIFAFFINLA